MLKPTLVSIVAVDGQDDCALLALAAGAACGLDASTGAAIVDSARERGSEIAAADRVQEAAGSGVVASVQGKTVVVGNVALFTSLGLSVARLGDWPERLQQRGQHVLFVAVDGQTVGFLGLINSGLSQGAVPAVTQ
jgi:cation transport ATPase